MTILASRTDGELPPDVDVSILPVRAFTNHGRNRRFAVSETPHADPLGTTRRGSAPRGWPEIRFAVGEYSPPMD